MLMSAGLDLPKMVFGHGFLTKGNLNLITQALAAVGCKMEVIPDPSTVHFHLPSNLSVRVHREYNVFFTELASKFPHEKEGIYKFYGECWKIFNALNSLELKSLEEPIYLFGQFFKKPMECLTLEYGAHDRPRSSPGEVAAAYEKTVTSESGCTSELNKTLPFCNFFSCLLKAILETG